MQCYFHVSDPTSHLQLTRQPGFFFWGGGNPSGKENGVSNLVIQAAKGIVEGEDRAQA